MGDAHVSDSAGRRLLQIIVIALGLGVVTFAGIATALAPLGSTFMVGAFYPTEARWRRFVG